MKPLLCALLYILFGSPFAFVTAHAHTQNVSHRISTPKLSKPTIPSPPPSPCTDFYEYVCSSVNDDLRSKTGIFSVYEEAMDYNEKLLLSSLSTGRARHLSASRAVSFLVDLYRKWASEEYIYRNSHRGYPYRAFDLAAQPFLFVLSRVYVDAAMAVTSPHYVSSLRVSTTQLAENVKNAIGRLLAAKDLLSKLTLEQMPISVGYENWYMDDTALDAFYGLTGGPQAKGLSFDPSSSYFDNYSNWIRHRMRKRGNPLSDWQLPVGRTVSWAQEVGMYLPLGYLFPAIFQHNISLASAYATIGSTTGHELLHNLYLSKNARFRAVSQCLISQYSAVREPQTGRTLPGAQTITEDIVDNGAIKGAFEAYRAAAKGAVTFHTDRQFFRSYARKYCNIHSQEILGWKLDTDVHTLQKYRVNLVLSNFATFSQTFSCPLGTPMNPVKKCTVL